MVGNMCKKRKKSIRFNITLSFAIAMVVIAFLTFLLVRFISSEILEGTTSRYLMSAVNSNADKIKYSKKKSSKSKIRKDIVIKYKKGYLQIDRDFLGVMNDVESGLYDGKGNMLYGKNPLAKDKKNEYTLFFTTSRIYKKEINKRNYYVYDRKVITDGNKDLWIRGMVSLAQEERQLNDITKVTAVFLPIVVILAILVGYFISNGLIRPIKKMENITASISRGSDLKKRIDLGNGTDELNMLADNFNEMMERLDEAFESEKRFISDASHELRTPMSVIMAQMELTMEKERSNEEYKAAMEVIGRQSSRMSTLIDNLLDYTRLEQRAQEYEMVEFNLTDLVNSICCDMKLIKTKDITLEYYVDDNVTIKGNQVLIARLLQNLIDNAYKYGNDNGHIYVTLSEDKENKKAILSVKDDGIGISKEGQKHIFDRFYREDTSRTHKKRLSYGYGLGLSMVKKISQMHKADCSVISEESVGSQFIVVFDAK